MDDDTSTIAIEGLPLDSHLYVVKNYGPEIHNNSLANDIPLIKVYLERIEGEKLTNHEEKRDIALPELVKVRIGTLWRNQVQQESYWEEFKNYEEELRLSFDLEESPAQSIIFAKDTDGTTPKLTSIPFDTDHILLVNNKSKLYHSTFTEMKSEQGHTVIVPSIELFISTYLPRNKLIRNELILNSIDVVLQNHLVDYHCSEDEYTIVVDKVLEKETLTFLAYLACNKKTRANVSKIWSSLAIDNVLEEKHPVVLPYHPKKLSFRGSGIWLDKETFFVQRIYAPKPPDEISIKVQKRGIAAVTPDDKKKNDVGNEETDIPQPTPPLNEKSVDKDTKISHGKNPGRAAGTKYVVSEVSPDNDDLDLQIEDIIIHVNDKQHYNYSQEEEEAEGASSGKLKGDKGSKKIARTHYVIEANPERLPLMKEIEDALQKLMDENKILNLQYIDDNTDEHGTLLYCSFNENHINLNDNKFWASGYVKGSGIKKSKAGYRKLLIVKITLEGISPFYLLEIDRKVKSDSFYGVFFNTGNEPLSMELLEDIKYVLASNRGRFDGKEIKPFPVDKAAKFRHQKESMKQRLSNALKIIEVKKVLD